MPVRDVNGYLQLGWIYTNSGDNGVTAPNRIYGSDDGFIRYYTPTNFATVMASYQQKRVSGNCAAGSSIGVIDSAGSVTCETDDVGATISGTDNYLARFNAAGNNIENSGIYDGSDARAITIDSLEYVGIGTTGPSQRLDVSGNIRFDRALYFSDGPYIDSQETNRLVLIATGYTYIPNGVFIVDGASLLRGGISDDGGSLELQDNTNITGNLNVTSGIYTNNIYPQSGGDVIINIGQ